ncbi:MAG TPA: lamin tail domain-containing protein [Patescibacteria group bacterium]|nr:lamin tail domain-containing protein [Patescibacteria group bacterium]
MIPPPPIPESTPEPTPNPDPTPLPSSPKTVRFNEILPNPSAKGDAGEFIELYNFGNATTDISGWIIRDATKTGKYTFPVGTIIQADAYVVITDQVFKLSLNNTKETLSLFDTLDTLIDSLAYEKTKDDISLNYTATGWRGGIPTPGAINHLNTLPNTKEKVPKKGFRSIPVEFRASGKDADGDTLKYTWDFGDGHKSYKAKTSHAYQTKGIYTVTLKTSDNKEDLLETFTITIRALSYPKVRITSLVPNPAGKDTDNEWILIENRDKKTVNLKGFGIATGWKKLANHPIREDFFIAPKQGRHLTREHSLFTLPNQKGKIELRAPDGKVLQDITYKLKTSAPENSVYKKEKDKRWEWEINQTTINTQSSTENDTLTTTDSAEPTSQDADAVPIVIETPVQSMMNTQPIEEEPKQTPDIALPKKGPQEFDANQKNPVTLLNYGTRARLPHDIIYIPTPETHIDTDRLTREHYAITFAKTTLATLNNSLNMMLNASPSVTDLK